MTPAQILSLFSELSALRLKSSPSRSELPRLAAVWCEALAPHELATVRGAALAHVRGSIFWPSISEVCAHLPSPASEEETAPELEEHVAAPGAPSEIEELNAILARCGRFPSRIVVAEGSGDCELSEMPSGSDVFERLSQLSPSPPRLRYWRLVLGAARLRLHKTALTLRVPLRSQAHGIAGDLLPAISALYGCKTVVFSD